MRGLKQREGVPAKEADVSHLLQMRGLKLLSAKLSNESYVASFTDAWIETYNVGIISKSVKSHLLQMRGLKQLTKAQAEYTAEVASFTDAWIETYKEIIEGRFDVSRIFYRCVD